MIVVVKPLLRLPMLTISPAVAVPAPTPGVVADAALNPDRMPTENGPFAVI